MLKSLIGAVAGILLLGTAANALPITFSDESVFLATASAGIATEDFESAALSGTNDLGAVSSLNFPGFAASSLPAALKVLGAPFVGNHNTTFGGSQFLSADTDIGNVPADITLTFGSPITEFGLFIIDLDVGGNGRVRISGTDYAIPATANGGVEYFGIITAPFTTVLISPGSFNSHWSIDDVSFRTAVDKVPEPATFELFGIGLAGLVLGGRRRRRLS